MKKFLRQHRGETHTAEGWKRLIAKNIPERKTRFPRLNIEFKSFTTYEQMMAYTKGVRNISNPSTTGVITEGITDSLQYIESTVDRLEHSANETKRAYQTFLADGIDTMLQRLMFAENIKCDGKINIKELYSNGFFKIDDYKWNYCNIIVTAYMIDQDDVILVETKNIKTKEEYNHQLGELDETLLRNAYETLKIVTENVFDKSILKVEENTGLVIYKNED